MDYGLFSSHLKYTFIYIYISPHVGIYVDVDLICDPTLLRT